MILERIKVVDDFAAEEGVTVLERWLVDDDLGTLGLDALHYALDGALAEVVGVGLHGQAVDADGDVFFERRIIGVFFVIAVVAGHVEDLVRNEVLAGAVGFDDGLDEVFWNVSVVGKKLLRILWQAVAAVTEGRVVVVRADARIEADAVDDVFCAEVLHFGRCVELVEV